MAALFSDECTIQNSPSNPRQWVFRYAFERFRQDFVNPASHGKPPISIMVWGMVWQRDGEGGMSKLVFCRGDPDSPRGGITSRSYCNVLEEGLLPYYESGDMFMQDNARVHVQGCTPAWLEKHGIWTIDWPPHSPDLNPIEHVWNALKRKICEIEPLFHELKNNISHRAWAEEIIERAWAEINLNLVHRLLESIPRRLAAVKKAKGWYTHY